jgi:predicted 2-oxoglutarate/Fe(II)-dependent dioxygenase YbiX
MFEIIKASDIGIFPNYIVDYDDNNGYELPIHIDEYFIENVLKWKEGDYNEIKKSSCKVYDKEQVDLTKRNSSTFKNKYIIKSDKLDEYLVEKNIVSSSYCTEEHSGLFGTSISYLTSFELLKYDVGGFFLKHRDKLFSNENSYHLHTHMCLLYPPRRLTEYTGGSLIIYDEDESVVDKIEIETSLFDDWTFVIFDQKTCHEITPVISGQRYVFKGQLYKRNENYVFPKFGEELDLSD